MATNETQYNARFQQKHDTEANWNLIPDFIPKSGEFIIYDPDDNYNYSRIKIGDGKRSIAVLPFVQNNNHTGTDTPEIYIGSGTMPDGYVLQVDPEGEPTDDLTQYPTINETQNMINEAIDDTDWYNLTLAEGFDLYSSSFPVKVRRINDIITLQGEVKPASTNNVLNSATHTTICTLPAQYRPNHRINILCQGSTRNIWMLSVQPDGVVSAARYRDENGYSATPPGTSTWLPFCITYMAN